MLNMNNTFVTLQPSAVALMTATQKPKATEQTPRLATPDAMPLIPMAMAATMP